MSDYNKINSIIERDNGYLIVANALEDGISKSVITNYVKKSKLVKAARGIYITAETWLDELYLLQLKNTGVFFR